MVIKKLILYNYRRFFLSNIKKLVFEPKSSIQFIIAKNGAGKSSLLSQLNPLPVDSKKDFYDTGYKEIEIEHKNNTYVLVSGTGNKGCSFKVNGTELNESNGKKVQLELVKDHFGLTPAILDILLGVNKFTSMSPSERKNWLSEMSTVDYSYSIKVYNKIKTNYRDIIGASKLLTDEIIKLENIILNNNEISILQEHKSKLEEYYQHVVSLYTHNVAKSEDVIQDINSACKAYAAVYDIIGHEPIDISSIEKKKLATQQELTSISSKIKYILDLIHKTEELNKIGSKDKIKKELSTIETQLSSGYRKSSELGIEPHMLKSVIDNFISNYTLITGYLDELKTYSGMDAQVKKITLPKWIDGLNSISNKITSNERCAELIRSEILHINSHLSAEHLIICPECKHTWNHGYDVNRVSELEDKLKNLIDITTSLKNKKMKIENIVNNLTRIDDVIKSIIAILKINSGAETIWIHTVGSLEIKPEDAAVLLSKLDTELITLQEYHNFDKILKKKEDLLLSLKTIEEFEKLHIQYKKDKIAEYELELEVLTKNKRELEIEMTTLNKLTINFEKFTNLRNNLLSLLHNNIVHYKAKTIEIRNEYIMKLVGFIKEELIELDKKISYNQHYRSKLEENKNLLESYKQKEKLLSILLKELSPTEGLIAKSINSFLKVFTKEMNYVINRIWTYDVEILPPNITNDDLDYKFKVLINEDETVEDVNKLSSSLKEIVDLAFRIVFMKYMKLQDFPLYLDEFGSTFDKAHRTAAYNIIDKVMSSDFIQIFSVCHYSDIYSSIINAEFNVLNSDNTDLGEIGSYNTSLYLE